jgi:hypothetical protein
MNVRIVSYEEVGAWILGKFALKLCENLKLQGVQADIGKTPDQSADINHHIIYLGYDGKKTTTETLMVTHVDTEWKLNMVRQQLHSAEMGICMSSDTVRKLTRSGISRDRLCYVSPAHDGVIKPRKVTLGITSKVQPSGCKRENMLKEIADHISPADFDFIIMGTGWDEIISELRGKCIEVTYYDHFDYDLYCKLMPRLDYYVYFGQDEGSMGFLDAVAAGVPTIVTPQGFHLDVRGGITYAFNAVEDLAGILAEIAEKKKRLTNAVSSWTWSEYARKHLLIWDYLLRKKNSITIPFQLSRDLKSLGVAENRRLAKIQTVYYRGVRKARRGVGKVKRHVENWLEPAHQR